MSQPPQPPYSGQPYPGQPSSGQPYQGGQPQYGQPQHGQPQPEQPQYGQPQYGQPQPEQPQYGQPQYGQPQYGQPQYPGQPNPDVPTSVPPQPSYPPTTAYPTSGQPEYGSTPPPPPYGQQPHYGQPEYGQPQFGQPGFPPQQPPKKKSKVLPIVLTSIAIVLVLCVGGVAALYMIGKNKVDDINDTAGDTTLPTTQTTQETAEPTKPASTIKIVEPATLGGRPKLTDPQFADIAKELKDGLAAVPSATNSVGSLYGTVEKQDIVVVAAAEAPIDDPDKELNQTFLGAGVGGLKITNITEAPTGSLGGSAKCGSTSTSGIDMAICSWADEGSLGMVIWYFKSVSKAKTEFPKLRAQIEKRS
ncbi:hypothetical protein BJ973_008685 [Actinoplanes tereljensis]|uniref:Flagellar basal body-associated protein FliL n=1 Tax=Paractinoplanes tereljensis TaxID=571912 RepID=A0A919NGU6_9ACTN|nr:hypothetical protein [Actinoplanes tereljensis]GIF18354.1 hypothetical protein Ate02nite_10840 [Actinoplanes tereljensis]